MKKLAVLTLLLAAASLVLASTAPRGEDMILLPSPLGTPGQLVSPNMVPGVDYNIIYADTTAGGAYLGNLAAGDTLGVWFVPPAGCTLLQVYFNRYHPSGVSISDPTHVAFASKTAAGVQLADYNGKRDRTATSTGPSPIGAWIQAPVELTATVPAEGATAWETLDVASKPDVATDPFYGAIVIRDINLNVLCENKSSPYPPATETHSLIYSQERNGNALVGWFYTGVPYQFMAKVRVYENLPAEVYNITPLPYSYEIGPRVATADIRDVIGVPGNLRGIASAKIHYRINSGSETVADMALASGDSTKGTYEATLPALPVGDTMYYYVIATDYQDAADTSATVSYVTKQGTPGAVLVLVENDDYYGIYSDDAWDYDPIVTALGANHVDVWDEAAYLEADASVLDYYRTGPGNRCIFWMAWSGFHFVAEAEGGFLPSFLDAGGKLFISSQDLIGGGFGLGYGDWTSPDAGFIRDYLKLVTGTDDYQSDTAYALFGVGGDPITGSPELAQVMMVPYENNFGNNWTGKIDSLMPGAEGIFYDVAAARLAYRYTDPVKNYQLVYTYFPFWYMFPASWTVGTPPDKAAITKFITNVKDYFGLVFDVAEKPAPVTKATVLDRAAPNPTRAGAQFGFRLATAGRAELAVYDAAGKLVRTLVAGSLPAGVHRVAWNGRDGAGLRVAAGVYFYRLTTDSYRTSHKLVVIE